MVIYSTDAAPVLSPKYGQKVIYIITGSIICVHLWANDWTNICEHTYTHIHIYTDIYIYTYMNVYMWTHSYTHTHNTRIYKVEKLEHIIYFLILFSVTSFSINGLSLQFKLSDTVKTFQAQKYERCDLKRISIAMTINYLSISRLFLLSL
jgi:ABC-type transport system involved in cytochrome c biogenesis permease subunit